ncbi:hypothetical protein PsorP6_012466 [Peronosclerospora sorghi]|uniref:Uncharacterized protein n=1 Tax=Peronosclerospora sorghi TaxID=230839 RepID=A0ACC0WGC1_9STRA|nr:hypothetical protein PsorP6_012466 [Peronosclerospora sorghi]
MKKSSVCTGVIKWWQILTSLSSPPLVKKSVMENSSDNFREWIKRKNDPERQLLEIDEFELLGVLGAGTFGVVNLAKHERTQMTVALKVLSKEQIVRQHQVKHIVRERAVHLHLQHPFIATLYGTFQDEKCVYFVVEYLPGGELWNLVYTQSAYTQTGECATAGRGTLASPLKDRDERCPVTPGSQPLHATNVSTLHSPFGGVKEEYAVFYLSCILSAIEYLHDQHLVHRDLKLENLVLDREGYPKLVDFGLSKVDTKKEKDQLDPRTGTLCGSTEYMAPEVLLRQSYDARVDLWSFGILMYELLLGTTPFYHENPRELRRRILTANVAFPPEFQATCPLACDLLTQLLVKNPANRLAKIASMKTHAFFTQVFTSSKDWDRLGRREWTAPFRPHLAGPLDTSFFQPMEDDKQMEATVAPYVEDGTHLFRDF